MTRSVRYPCLRAGQSIEARIKQLRADIDALIDAHVSQMAGSGVPAGVIRQCLEGQALKIAGDEGGCQCAAFLALSKNGTL